MPVSKKPRPKKAPARQAKTPVVPDRQAMEDPPRGSHRPNPGGGPRKDARSHIRRRHKASGGQSRALSTA